MYYHQNHVHHMSKRILKFGRAIGALALSGACSLAPHYEKPTVVVSTSFQGSTAWVSAVPADQEPRGEWWLGFNDAGLNRLEAQFRSDNQSLKAAYAGLESARQQVKAARSLLLPSISANVGASRSRTSQNSPSYNASRGPFSEDFTANASTSYELDLFGRLSNSFQTAKAQASATEGDVRSLELSLRVQVAITYFSIHALDGEGNQLNSQLQITNKALAQAQALYKGGAYSKSDLDAVLTQYATLKSQIDESQLRRSQLEHALAVLVGADPSSFKEPVQSLTTPHDKVYRSQALPTTVLQRRPDVAAAERRVRAANAGVGVARAAYLPVFNLGGQFGRESLSNNTWWNEPSLAWSGAVQGGVLLLDAGRRSATIKSAQSNFDAQVALYRQTVLSAVADVEDQLTARAALSDEQVEAMRALDAARSSAKIAAAKYSVGTATAMDVARAEAQLSAATIAALDTEVRFLAAELNLIRAIGGTASSP